jgi:hypothetical protein
MRRYIVANQKHKRTLIYKRTHEGDPHPDEGIFGNNKCMGRVRGWSFDAVIGVGGIGREPEQEGIARKLTWVGICRQEVGIGKDGHPLLRFAHFWYDKTGTGPLLKDVAPELASHMYDKGARVLMNLSSAEQKEVDKILDLAKDSPPSGQSKGVNDKRCSNSRHDISKSCKTEQVNSDKAKKRCS